jgi:hypothetical protein
MSKESVQIKAMMRNPKAQMDYQLTNKLPDAVCPSSPLIAFLESISPRERLRLRNIKLSTKLGYQSNANFSNGQLMLNYLKPSKWVVGNWPAKSCQITNFRGTVTLDTFNKVQEENKR